MRKFYSAIAANCKKSALIILTVVFCLMMKTESSWGQTITMSNTNQTTCSATYYDPGGTGNYGNSLYITQTISPGTAGNAIRIAFSSFSTENNFDYLYIYNGSTATAGSLIGIYTGTTSPGTITSTAADGSLTFVFTSNNNTVKAGWIASLTCITQSSAISMTGSSFSTCSATYYDPQGTSNYLNNTDFTQTIYPATPGNALQIAFSSFSLEVGGPPYDYLRIYNGNSTAAPLIGQYSGTTSPGTITSTATDGSLTFVFHSDGGTTKPGWVANISCISTASITTGTITGSPFCVTASTGASVSVPFTSSGTFTTGNDYTAQLSNATGSFTAPTTIGTLNNTSANSGTITATIPAGTVAGTGYRIRVISNGPAATGTDNGTNLTINLAANSIAPAATQNINAGANGTALLVSENPGVSSRTWYYSTTSGGPYTTTTGVTSTSYTPIFATQGTYFVVCVSTYSCGTVTSNQVQINVAATIATGAISGSPFCVTASVGTTVTVPFTSVGTFSGNTYTAQLSNAAGSFSSAVNIGNSVSNANSGTITATIPANTVTGTGYRIRVVSNGPVVNGADNGSNLIINLAANSIAPGTTQNIITGANGTALTVTEQSTPSTRTWFYGTTSGGPYTTNTGNATTSYTPNFATPGTYYVVCVSTFACNTITSNQVQVNVAPTYKSQFISMSTGSATWCPGETRTVSVTVKNIGTGTWISTGPNPFNIGVKWNTNGANWADYYVRTSALDLAPGATGTYTFSITASNNVGAGYTTPFAGGTTNNLTFDVVEEGVAWFGNNNGTPPVGPGNTVLTSATQIIAGNSIGLTTTQNINAGVNGTTLNVTETPAASSRMWYYSTTSGGPYTTSTGVMSTSYMPNFAAQGTYYVVCASTYSCGNVISNQVQINVTATITTSAITGSPYCSIAGSAGSAVSVPFTSAGAFIGNTYTAQLSSSTGVFPGTNIGTLVSDLNSGTISATIPAGTATGAGYKIRVISSNPAVTGSSSAAFTINLSANSISGTTPQNINVGVNGTALSAVESAGVISRTWYYGTTSGGPYSTSTGVTTTSYIPNFATQGTYYVVCVSTYSCGSVTSNQAQINVAATVTTGTISGSPFCSIAGSAGSAVSVPFTSAGAFTGNTYTAQLSSSTGVFPGTNIGTLVSDLNSGTISATIPAGTATGAGYKIRVISSNPAVTGSSSAAFTVNLSTNSIGATTTQNINVGVGGTALNVTESAGVLSRTWYYSTTSGGPYTTSTGVTNTSYTPNFATQGTYYVVCVSTYSCGSVTSNQVQINVAATITTGTISGSPFCVTATTGSAVSVPFTSAGAFTSNTYTAQLSNAAGSFAAPVNIGTLVSDLNSGIISATIPAGTATGAGYRIRVISSSPVITGSTNSTNLTIVTPTVNMGAPLADICEQSTSALLNTTVGGSATGGTWSDGGVGGTFNPTATNSVSTTWTAPVGFVGTAVLTLTTTGGTCSTSGSKNQVVNARPLPTFTSAPIGNICAGSSVTYTTETGQSGYVWGYTGAVGIGYAIVSGGTSSSSSVTLQWLTPGTKTVTVNYNNANSCNSITATSISNNVNARPTANITSTNTSICNPGSINITGTVTAIGPWTVTLSNGATATGTGNGAFSITVSPITTTTYTLTSLVDANCTSNSTDLTGSTIVTVYEPVNITTQPDPSQTTCATFPVNFTVAATGTGLTYQWYQRGTPDVALVDNSNISGSQTSSLDIVQAGIVDAGTYYVIVSGLSPCGFVQSSDAVLVVNQQIVINTQPTPQVVCAGGAATFTIDATGTGIMYEWRKGNVPLVDGGNISGSSTSTLVISPATAADAATTYNVVLTSPGGSCPQANSVKVKLTVNPVPLVNAVSNKVICNNAATGNINFSGGVSGTVYDWTNDNTAIGLSASGTGNISSFTATNSGTSPLVANITVTPSYTNAGVTCTGLPVSFTITVNPTSVVNPIAGQEVCNGDVTTAINFSSTAAGGTIVYNWTNNKPSIGLAASGSGDIASFNAVNNGTAVVTATIRVTPSYTNGSSTCIGTPMTFTINVNPTATVNPVPNQTVCNNTSTTTVIFGSPTIGGTIVYDWTNSTPSIGLAAVGSGTMPSFTATNSGTSPLTATITVTPSYSNGSGTCTGMAQIFTITVNPVATVNTVSNQTVCSGLPTNAITFSSPTTGGAIVYNWTNSAPSIGLAASGSGDIASFNAVNNGTVAITANITVTPSYTNGSTTCAGTPTMFSILVNPQTIITPLTQSVCSGSTITTINAAALPVGGITSWTRNSPAGITSSVATLGSGPIAGTFTSTNTTSTNVDFIINTTAANGCTAIVNATVTVYSPLVPPTVASSQIICTGSSAAPVTGTPATGGSGSYSYQWKYSNNGTTNWTFIAGATGLSYSPPVISRFYHLVVTNACGSDTSNAVQISTAVDFGLTFSGNVPSAPICSGDDFDYTETSGSFTALFSGGKYIRYTWQSQNSGYFTSPTTNPYGQSHDVYLFGFIYIGTYYDGSATFTVHNNTNAPITQNLLVTPNVYNSNGTIYCNLSPEVISVIINPVPVIGSYTANICSSGTGFNVTPTNGLPTTATIVPAGTKYSWSAPSVAGISGTAPGTNQTSISGNPINNTNAPITVNYVVTASYTSSGTTCVGTSTFTVAVTVNPTPKIQAQTTAICSGASFNFTPANAAPTTIVPSGTTYSWSAPAGTGFTGGSSGSGSSITGTLSTTSATPVTAVYTVTPTSGAAGNCVGATFTVTVTVNPTVNPGTVSGTSPLCIGNTVTYTTNGNTGGTWSSSNASVATVVLGTGVVTATGAGTANISYTINTGCGSPLSASASVTVNPNVTSGTVSSTLSTICIGATTTYSSSGTAGGTWSSSNTAVASVNPSTGVVTGSGAGMANIIYTVTGCNATTPSSLAVTVNPDANAGIVSGSSPLCIGINTLYTSSGDGGGAWTSTNTSVATIDASGNVTAMGPGTTNITYTVSTGCNSPKSVFKTLTVSPNANAGTLNGPSAPICVGTTISFTSTGDVGGAWTTSDPTVATVNTSGFVKGIGPGTATITYTISAGCNPPSSANKDVTVVSVGATLNPGPISGQVQVCKNSTGFVYSVAPDLSGNTSFYVWTVPSGWNITSGSTTNTITVNTNGVASNGNITVTAGNACGFSTPSTLAVKATAIGQWIGITADWNDGPNWCSGTPPDATIDVTIPVVGSGFFYPIVSTAVAMSHNLTIASGASLTVIGNTLQIGGNITNAGSNNFNVTAGTVEFNATSGPPQTIPANVFATNKIENLIISYDVNLMGQDSITGHLSFGSTGKNFNTNGNLTLKSTINATSSVGQIISGNKVNGDVTVERYIATGPGSAPNHGKSWQLLAIPTTGGQSIKEAWQDTATLSNLSSPGAGTQGNRFKGYGTMLTTDLGGNSLGAQGLGFDEYTSPGPSIKVYNYNLGASRYDGPTSTAIPIYNPKGYFVFVRGDRSVNAFNLPANPTILRTKGKLFDGNGTNNPPMLSLGLNAFESVGNPYASPIDFRLVVKTNLADVFQVWDPRLGGGYNYGAFQTFTKEIPSGNYVVTPGGGSYGIPGTDSVQNFIQSGQAFFVQTIVNQTGSISFTEAVKGDTASVLFTTPARVPQLQTSLRTYIYTATGTPELLDGVLSEFGSNYSNSLDASDARKSTNTGENLSIKTAGRLLAVERRQLVTAKDTIFLNLTTVRAQGYRFRFDAVNLNTGGLQGYLEDTYLHTQTPLNMTGTTSVDFTIANIPGSYAADRFRIVFTQSKVLPVTFTEVKAYKKDKNINVEWRVENELNIKDYTVEKSTDGIHFTAMSTTAATGNGSSIVSYVVLDDKPVTGYNYYRVRSNDQGGKTSLTQVVKVLMGTLKHDINIYPNPITDGMIHLQFMNEPEGKYKIRLLNKLGQTILAKQVTRMDGNSTELIKWDFKLAHGMYQLEVTKPDGSVKNINVLY